MNFDAGNIGINTQIAKVIKLQQMAKICFISS